MCTRTGSCNDRGNCDGNGVCQCQQKSLLVASTFACSRVASRVFWVSCALPAWACVSRVRPCAPVQARATLTAAAAKSANPTVRPYLSRSLSKSSRTRAYVCVRLRVLQITSTRRADGYVCCNSRAPLRRASNSHSCARVFWSIASQCVDAECGHGSCNQYGYCVCQQGWAGGTCACSSRVHACLAWLRAAWLLLLQVAQSAHCCV